MLASDAIARVRYRIRDVAGLVFPVAELLQYLSDAQAIVAFAPGESFFANFLRLLGEPVRPAEVVFLAPIGPGDAEGRRRIAETARERIVAAMAP